MVQTVPGAGSLGAMGVEALATAAKTVAMTEEMTVNETMLKVKK